MLIKERGQDAIFARTTQRSGRYVIKALGDRPITAYSSSDAAKFRDYLFEKGLSLGSVKRIFGTIRAVINLTIREQGIEGKNAFANTYMPERDDKKSRQPLTSHALTKLQRQCMAKDDEARWLLALISDTGMRLAEAAGLLMSDIQLFADPPTCDNLYAPLAALKNKE